ncbi:STY4526/YPO1902 family pathogenicity island replication protein, partial [Pseudomonas savastanoi]
GATTPMLQQFFGMSPQEVSLQRVLVGVPGKPGRFRDLPDDTPLWHRFVQLMADLNVDHTDGVALLDVAMLLTEEINIPAEEQDRHSPEPITLGLVWNKIQQWLAQDLYPPGKNRKSASLVLMSESRRLTKANPKGRASEHGLEESAAGKVEGERM